MTFGYPAEHNRFVFGVDDVARARVLLEGEGGEFVVFSCDHSDDPLALRHR